MCLGRCVLLSHRCYTLGHSCRRKELPDPVGNPPGKQQVQVCPPVDNHPLLTRLCQDNGVDLFTGEPFERFRLLQCWGTDLPPRVMVTLFRSVRASPCGADLLEILMWSRRAYIPS